MTVGNKKERYYKIYDGLYCTSIEYNQFINALKNLIGYRAYKNKGREEKRKMKLKDLMKDLDTTIDFRR